MVSIVSPRDAKDILNIQSHSRVVFQDFLPDLNLNCTSADTDALAMVGAKVLFQVNFVNCVEFCELCGILWTVWTPHCGTHCVEFPFQCGILWTV